MLWLVVGIVVVNVAAVAPHPMIHPCWIPITAQCHETVIKMSFFFCDNKLIGARPLCATSVSCENAQRTSSRKKFVKLFHFATLKCQRSSPSVYLISLDILAFAHRRLLHCCMWKGMRCGQLKTVNMCRAWKIGCWCDHAECPTVQHCSVTECTFYSFLSVSSSQ